MRSRSAAVLLALAWWGAGCASVSEPARPPEAVVEAAVRYAFGLETTLFAAAAGMTSRADVAAHFRQGFAGPYADDLADYFWRRDRLRTGDPTLLPPERVTVLRVEGGLATAYFETPVALREAWDLPRYTIATLVRQGGRWVVSDTAQQDAPPIGA